MSECTLVPPVLAAVREKHPDVRARLDRRARRSQHARDDAERLSRRHAVRAAARLVLRRLAPSRPASSPRCPSRARGARRRPRPRPRRARQRRPLAAARVRRRRGRPGRAPGRRRRSTCTSTPTCSIPASRPMRASRRPGGWSVERMRTRARDARRERPRRRALGLPERAAGARRRGPRAARRGTTLSAGARMTIT